ncbi:MAG: aminoacyl-tRNA hydrolase [Puniceicoccales bacterium]|jgi:PTH1 family peptidyl-tRNA hydrolase|nr:aminoacyl-tRNA hydrolase [Puniceicoccales bacterium]
MSYSLVVGLGNPGKEYELTRHNAGFLAVDAFAAKNGLRWSADRKYMATAARHHASGRTVILAKPTTFMNGSGTAVSQLCNYYKISPKGVIIIHDDVAFAVGDYRIHIRESSGGHNGIADILSKIGSEFTRYRIGIGAVANEQIELSEYVLGKFTGEELQILKSKTSEILEHLQLLLDKGIEHAMNLANRKKFYE